MIFCDSSSPGVAEDGLYVTPYVEAVEGYHHAYKTRQGVEWTRNWDHPEDPRCPACWQPAHLTRA